MDEISLLRQVRNDIPERAPEDVARRREALLAHIDGAANPIASSHRHSTRTATWLGVSLLTAAAVAIALAIAPNVLSGNTINNGNDQIVAAPSAVPTATADVMVPASVVTVMKAAAIETLKVSDPVVGPGQYSLIQTNAVGRTSGSIEADRAKIEAQGGESKEEDLVSYLQGVREDLYIPANRDNEWVWVRHAPTVVETFGPRSEALAQESETFPGGTERLPGGAFTSGGSTIDSYYIGTEPVRGYDALPRDPQQLLGTIYDLTVGQGQSPDGEALVWIADRLRTGTVPADLRAALYEAAAMIPGVTITEQQATLDGTTGIAIGRAEPYVYDDVNGTRGGFRQDIIIDPTTGQFIGEREVLLKAFTDMPAGAVTRSTSVTTTVVDSAP
ncbi:hypothetical protein CVS47_01771 [Microbacterium lemovicicum]|uniref:Uncharacterized protein n=1 Tax=Microbacterium lemovicicum TaxID=1072463 RepID=A0A3S9WAN3_9MICO|nr:CU044_5270 family protein [Microbacterium lemovicicum]AZS37141.1 hypothetical protein CVS47_01771 [Microbacterium lemovicicum]